MSAPDIPTSYTVTSTTTLGGSVDVGLDDIRIKELAPIRLTTDNKLTSESQLTSDSKVDLGLNDIRIRELPRIDLRLETSMKPTRVHFPINLRFGVQSLGMELLAFSICGESMVIVEDYVPHRTEICL